LFKEIVDGRTDARTDARTTDDGRRTLKDHKSSLSTSCSGELKMYSQIASTSVFICVSTSRIKALIQRKFRLD